MGKIMNPIPPEMDQTAVVDFEAKDIGDNQELIEAILHRYPSLQYIAESTGYHRFDDPWWFSGKMTKGAMRVGPKNFVIVGNKPTHMNIPSLQPWKITKPVTLIGRLRIPAGAVT